METWKAEIVKQTSFNKTICVPKEWTEKEVTTFAGRHWRAVGDRVQCLAKHDYVHIGLEKK